GEHRRWLVAVEPGGRVARCSRGTTRHVVVRGIGPATAIVEAALHHRPVDLALQEGDQHLLAPARQHDAAPVVARPPGGDPPPGPGRSIAWRIVPAAWM